MVNQEEADRQLTFTKNEKKENKREEIIKRTKDQKTKVRPKQEVRVSQITLGSLDFEASSTGTDGLQGLSFSHRFYSGNPASITLKYLSIRISEFALRCHAQCQKRKCLFRHQN